MKHSLHEKTTASVLLELFISSNKFWHTADAPERMSGTQYIYVYKYIFSLFSNSDIISKIAMPVLLFLQKAIFQKTRNDVLENTIDIQI